MRYLITGGAGFIGSHLAERLLEQGERVVLLDNLSTGSMENIRHLKGSDLLEYHLDGIENRHLLAELVDDADVIVHLAAAVGVKLIVESPVRTIETNVNGTQMILEAACKKKKLVLIASTSEVYGKNTQVPISRRCRSGPRADHQGTLELCRFQSTRRVPRSLLLERETPARHRRAFLQHRWPTSDRPLRYGSAQLCKTSS